MKDWTGNSRSMLCTVAPSNHSATDRAEHDYYATEPRATELLLGLEKFAPRIWEPACGAGHMANVLAANGYEVKATDLIDRGFGTGGVDFLAQTEKWDGDIITNPPYKFSTEFVEKALELVADGAKVAMFLKLTFLEGKTRRAMFNSTTPCASGCRPRVCNAASTATSAGRLRRLTRGSCGKRATRATRF